MPNSKAKSARQKIKEITGHLTTLVDTYYIYNNQELDKLTHWTNDCYNEINYLRRQKYFANIRQFKYNLHLYKVGKLKKPPKLSSNYTMTELSQLIKMQSVNNQNTLYKDCINTKLINSTIKMVKDAWSSYSKAKSDFKKHPYKYLGCPKIPKYSKPGSRHSTNLDTQTIKIKGNYLVYDKLNLKIKMSPMLQEAVYGETQDYWLKQLTNKQRIRTYWIKPINNGVKLCVSYVISSKPRTTYKNKPVPKRIKGIIVSGDPGVDNLLALVTNNLDFNPLIINGKGIKSVNHFYNYQKAHLQKVATKYKQHGVLVHKKDGTSQIVYRTGQAFFKLLQWRNNKILEAIHKATDRVIEYAIDCGAEKIVIGRNKYWKQKSNMGKQNNQNFAGIPHYQVVKILTYKAKLYGIEVISQPESYTSQTSFLDKEFPCWKNGNKARAKFGKSPVVRRKQRGLFESNQGYKINADINGALQIARKYNPNLKVYHNRIAVPVNSKWLIGCVLHPQKWSPKF